MVDTARLASGVAATERVLEFEGQGQALVGVLTIPPDLPTLAVVIVVGGPQYRAGSHRQFVHLARHLAAQGHAVLRFDLPGMGDSAGPLASFEAVDDAIAAALDALWVELPHLHGTVLWGLCDGASASLLYCHHHTDRRVLGLALANPWVRSQASLARAQVKHYYRQRLFQREFWQKALRGGVGPGALAGLIRRAWMAIQPGRSGGQGEPTTFQERMADGWRRFPGPILLLLSGQDITAAEFTEHVAGDPAWQGLLQSQRVERHHLPQADHTFSGAQGRVPCEQLTAQWLARLAPRSSCPQPQ